MLSYKPIFCVILLLHVYLVVVAYEQGEAAETGLFPFLVDQSQVALGNITDISGWLEKPAGENGFISTREGHFVTGDGRPIRFLGVNLAYSGNFPDHAGAEKLARQLARFGVNLVRFHNMDESSAPAGIWQQGIFPRVLDLQQLDRLDFLVAKLKENGIYSDFNLHVARTMRPEEGFPAPERRPKFDKGLNIYHPDIITYQKDYARNLLTHRNPYTGNRYVDEPAIAMVEITNEDGLIDQWKTGSIDALPALYQRPLDELWLEWLKARYGTTESLRISWSGIEGSRDLALGTEGPELVANGNLDHGTDSWSLQTDAIASATMVVVASGGPVALTGSDVAVQATDSPWLQVRILKKGAVGWLPQFQHVGIALKPGEKYLLSFWLKADQRCQVTANVKMNHAPWADVWWSRVEVDHEWKQFNYIFHVPVNADIREAWFGITDTPTVGGVYGVAGVSIRETAQDNLGLPEGESLEHGINRPLRVAPVSRTEAVQRDYLEFLWDVERRYFDDMYRFIKDELGARAMVSGTQVEYSPSIIQERLDYIDTHAYWDHPTFPATAWDSQNWYVQNNSMVASTTGGTLTKLALTRIDDRPFVVSEYNHSAPNTFSSEAFLLAGAYGAFQDWDGLFAFAWSHNGVYWPTYITNSIDIKSHPTKLVTLPAAAALFLRGDVTSDRQQVLVPLNEKDQLHILTGRGIGAIAATAVGVPDTLPLQRRVAIGTGHLSNDADDIVWSGNDQTRETRLVPSAGSEIGSSTGELRWDLSGSKAGLVVIDTPRSKAVIGYGSGRSFDLSGVRVTPGPTLQNGWSAITLTVIEGEDFATPGRILITATGYVENTGMGWENLGGAVTVRDRWGQGPPLVEGIPARLELPASSDHVCVYALDRAGNRRETVPIAGAAAEPALTADEGERPASEPVGHASFEIGPEYRTLWYEVEILPAYSAKVAIGGQEMFVVPDRANPDIVLPFGVKDVPQIVLLEVVPPGRAEPVGDYIVRVVPPASLPGRVQVEIRDLSGTVAHTGSVNLRVAEMPDIQAMAGGKVLLSIAQQSDEAVRLRGETPLDIVLGNIGSGLLAEVYVQLIPIKIGERLPSHVLYSDIKAPEDLRLDALAFADGAYDLEVGIKTISGMHVEAAGRIVINNWTTLVDELKPPTGGWFGALPGRLTISESDEWQDIGAASDALFGDADRITRRAQSNEHLTWKLEELRDYKLTLYAPDPTVVRETVQVLVSSDQETWLETTYAIAIVGESEAGWLKMELQGETCEIQARYLRVSLVGNAAKPEDIQLGRVEIRAPIE